MILPKSLGVSTWTMPLMLSDLVRSLWDRGRSLSAALSWPPVLNAYIITFLSPRRSAMYQYVLETKQPHQDPSWEGVVIEGVCSIAFDRMLHRIWQYAVARSKRKRPLMTSRWNSNSLTRISPSCASLPFPSLLSSFTKTSLPYRYRVGESFLHVPYSHAIRRLKRDASSIAKQLEQVSSSVLDSEQRMKDLKIILYSKFGTAINLDE